MRDKNLVVGETYRNVEAMPKSMFDAAIIITDVSSDQSSVTYDFVTTDGTSGSDTMTMTHAIQHLVPIDKLPEQVKIDAWKAEYALLLIKQCHFSLAEALSNADAQLENIGDIDDYTPQEAVDEEIDAMRANC